MSKWVKISWCYLKISCDTPHNFRKCVLHKPYICLLKWNDIFERKYLMLQSEKFGKVVFAQSTWKFTMWYNHAPTYLWQNPILRALDLEAKMMAIFFHREQVKCYLLHPPSTSNFKGSLSFDQRYMPVKHTHACVTNYSWNEVNALYLLFLLLWLVLLL